FGTNLLFAVEDEPAVVLGVEICEDLWAPVPPSSFHALAGATVLANLSASSELVAKAEYRRELVKVQSGRALAAYVYANNGVHESTTDVVFAGQLLVAENAVLVAEGRRFRREGDLVVTDVDTERLLVERMRQTSFSALLVVDRTFDLLGLSREGILAVTMPGFGTTARTLQSARDLARASGVHLREIDIRAACAQHMRDIGLDPEDTSSLAFQNLQ